MKDTGQVFDQVPDISEAEKRGHAAVEKLLAELDAKERLLDLVRKQHKEPVITPSEADTERPRRSVLSSVTNQIFSYFVFGGRYGAAPA